MSLQRERHQEQAQAPLAIRPLNNTTRKSEVLVAGGEDGALQVTIRQAEREGRRGRDGRGPEERRGAGEGRREHERETGGGDGRHREGQRGAHERAEGRSVGQRRREERRGRGGERRGA